MKKILTVSLVAIMAVSAANAEIASTNYVTDRTGDVKTLTTTATNLTGAVNELKTSIDGLNGNGNNAAATKGELSAVEDKADANTTAIAALDDTYATDDELTTGLALKQDVANIVKAEGDLKSDQETAQYPSIAYLNTVVKDVQDGMSAEIVDSINDLNNTVANNKTAAESYADQAKEAAIAVAGTAADAKIAAALEDYSTTTEMNAAIKTANDTQTLTITNAYTAADSVLKTELESKITTASGGASKVASDLASYQTSNDAAVEAARKAADDAQADANANAAAIADLDTTYVSESEMTAFESSNTTAISTAKTEAIAAAKTETTTQVSALAEGAVATNTTDIATIKNNLGALNGIKIPVACTTGRCALVMDEGKAKWETINY